MSLAAPNTITFGDQCPDDPCNPCGSCSSMQYSAALFGAFFAPLFLDKTLPPATIPIPLYLTKTIHVEFTPLFGHTAIYDCVINVDPYTNDVSISDSGDNGGYYAMMELINDQFQDVDFTVDFINVNCPGTFLGDVTGYVQLSNPFDRTAIQAGIDELLNQLTWDDVKADLAILAAQNPGSNPCGLCVNWKNHYQNGNGLSYDAAPPWAGGPANFFAAPMPDIDNRQQYNLFDVNGHMLNPYNTTIGAKILEFGFISGVFGGDEKGDLLISFPDVVANQGTHGIIGTVFEFVASKILVVAGGPYCDDGITQDYIGGIPQPPPPETRTNITFAPGAEIPRIPFVWLDNYAWRVVIHEYFPGTC